MMNSNPFLQPNKIHQSNKFLNILQIIGLVFAVLLLGYFFVFTPSEVDGPSMEPTLHTGELLMTNRLVQYLGGSGGIFGDYKRGDVVIFHSEELNDDIVKRIIGIPGDTVQISNGSVFVNGNIVNEPYLAVNERTLGSSFASEGRLLTVPANSYFVLGDNRDQSKDSRSTAIGFLSRTEIKGKAIIRIWPINTFRIL